MFKVYSHEDLFKAVVANDISMGNEILMNIDNCDVIKDYCANYDYRTLEIFSAQLVVGLRIKVEKLLSVYCKCEKEVLCRGISSSISYKDQKPSNKVVIKVDENIAINKQKHLQEPTKFFNQGIVIASTKKQNTDYNWNTRESKKLKEKIEQKSKNKKTIPAA